MALPPAIDVVQHDASPPLAQTRYLLRYLAEVWARWGIDVRRIGPRSGRGRAGLGWLHVDGTRTPGPYVDLARGYGYCINGRVLDISKSGFSRNLLREGDDWDGPVIVKTDANFGGQVDASFSGTGTGTVMDPRNYPVLPSMAAVPPEIWRRPELVIEKLRCERDDAGRYCLRVYYFLGDREMGEFDAATAPVAKGPSIVARQRLTEFPEELRALRRELGFDFGKFDFAIVDGEVVVYDINRTPIVGPTNLQMVGGPEALEEFARGIEAFG